MRGRSAARIFWPSVCPIGPSRKAAETRLATCARMKASRLDVERQRMTRSPRRRPRPDRRRARRRQRKLPQRLAIPGRAGGERQRPRPAPSFPGAVRRKASATASALTSMSACQSAASAARKHVREQDRVGARRAESQEIDEPAAERGRVGDVAALHGPFQPMRIGEGADRECRREPEIRGSSAAPASTPQTSESARSSPTQAVSGRARRPASRSLPMPMLVLVIWMIAGAVIVVMMPWSP